MCVQFTKGWEILEGGFLTYSAYVAGMMIILLFHKSIFSFNVKKISFRSVNKTKKKKNNKRVLYVHKSIDSFKVFRWKWQQKKHIIVQNIFLQFKNYVKCLKTSFWILKKHDTHVMIWEGCLNLLILIFVFQEIML